MQTDEGETIAKVQAKKLGKVAIHKNPKKDSTDYNVSSVTLGIALCTVATEVDALRIGEYLWSKACIALMEESREEMLKVLPTWVKPWCLTCREHGKWIDPLPFQEGS